MPESEKGPRIAAALALACGLLVLGLSGTCTLAMGRGNFGSLLAALIFGGPFIVLGAFTVIAAIGWLRGEPPRYAGGLGSAYMVIGCIGALAGLGFRDMAVPIWAVAAVLVGVGWRLTRWAAGRAR